MMTEMDAKTYQRREVVGFEDFFRSVFPRARAAAARIAGPTSGEDLAVEALARAYARWRAVCKMDHPEAWVIRVVTNAALDEVRRKKAFLPSVTIPDVSAELIARENMLGALRILTRRQQEVVVLRFIVDMSEADVAQTLGISKGSVKSHLHRAIPQLRAHLSIDLEGTP
jgi:RNA polymerase sigma factor (sigma-70 family)